MSGECQLGDKFFPTGSDAGVNLFLNYVPVHGIFWVVNINEDLEMLDLSKNLLHDLIFGHGQLKEAILIIVFN